MSESVKEVVETLDPVSQRLVPPVIHTGTLAPLKTILELRDSLTIGTAYITRAPNKITNDVVNVARSLVGEDTAKNLPHLRRCVKPGDIPAHLKARFMNVGNGRQVHTGKSNWLYIILGPKDAMPYEELVKGLLAIEEMKEDIFIAEIPIPLLAPTSQAQSNLWSHQFWQTVYRKNNPLGPHPSTISRTETTISRDAAIWMNMAHQIAMKGQKAGIGEPIGAVIVKRTIPGKPEKPGVVTRDRAKEANVESDSTNVDDPKVNVDKCDPDCRAAAGDTEAPVVNEDERLDGTDAEGQGPEGPEFDVPEEEKVQIVAMATDARWHQQEKTGRTGNPMAHAALRAISMVAQKLVRAENKPRAEPQIMEFESFQDKPLLDEEQMVFDVEHPRPDGYLCHELELYITHEPCTMCAMSILHSRMGKIVFRQRMPLTGGMAAEDRGYNSCGASGLCDQGQCGGGLGLGLHYRKELNWTLLGWQWESDSLEELPVDAHLHA
ncbi:hypothetical protein M426DRAFT_155735 [Hypoxylon sp. CI-4A]|nr:hypothetical protein M426DRAFT_155735 [Hypoxylon sp. CI-4A]